MSTYRYVTTDILTGQVLFDNLPCTVSSASAQINGIGQLSGTLQLRTDLPLNIQLDILAAVEPWKSVFWVLQDNIPVWCGPVTSWSPTTATGSQLPFQAATMETMLQYRLIDESINFVGVDIGFVFRELLLFAISKQPNGYISGLNISGQLLGIVDNVSFDGSYLQTVYDALNVLVNAYDLEYTFQPAMTSSGNLVINLLLSTHLGRYYTDSNLMLSYPSKTVLDYQWQRQANNPANAIIATGTTPASVTYLSDYPHGYNFNELNALYPLMEGSVSISQPINAQSDADAYSDGWVQTTSVTQQITPVLVMGQGAFPRIRELQLGDELVFVATSPLHPADPVTGAPGLQCTSRITGWTLSPPMPGTPETASVNLGGIQEKS